MKQTMIVPALGLAASLAIACSDAPLGTQARPAEVEILFGGGQLAVISSVLPQAVRVRVVDSSGHAVPRQLVTFNVTSGGGTANDASAITDDDGIAETKWTLGASVGVQNLEVRAVNALTGAKFTSTVVTAAGLTGKLVFVVQPQSAVEYATITPSVQVAAQDMSGNAAQGFTGAVTIGVSGGPPGSLGSYTAGAVNGVATFPGLSISDASTGYTLSAAAQGLVPVSSTAFDIVPNTPARLAFSASPAPSFTGSPIFPAPRVSVLDQTGHPVKSFSAPITITLGQAPAGATISGATTALAAAGLATFPGLTVDLAGTYELTASAAVVESATTASFSACAGCWLSKPAMPTARYRLGVASLNGQVYAVGGLNSNGTLTRVDAYDPATATWTSKPPIPTARYEAATAVVNGILYVVGGFVKKGDGGSESPIIEAYDPTTNSWTTRSPMLTARRELGVAGVSGILYAVGGVGDGIRLGTVEAYNPVTNSWSTRAPVPAQVFDHGIGVIDGVIYVAGGVSDNQGQPTSTLFAYDPAIDTWTSKAALPAPVTGAAAAVVNGRLFVMGGCCGPGSSPYSSVWVYDPSTDLWAAGVALPSARALLGAAVVAGVIYAEGGYGAASTVLDRNDAFKP